MDHRFSARIEAARGSYARGLGWYHEEFGGDDRRRDRPGALDLAFGDPHEEPSAALVQILRDATTPRSPLWYAYRRGDAEAQSAVASRVSSELRFPVSADDVTLTNGSFAGISACLNAVCGPSSEVVYVVPSWFYYEPIILGLGAVPVPVAASPSWHLDLSAIAGSLTPRTSAIIINSPNNPTGAVYSGAELRALSALLNDASQRYGQPIYLISDEAYRRLVYASNCPSPLSYYPYSVQVYTYTKALGVPGVRLGYIVVSPTMPDRDAFRDVVVMAQLVQGWAFPGNALIFALEELNRVEPPTAILRGRRDELLKGLARIGLCAANCEGTFYAWVESPDGGDLSFVRGLADAGLYVLPGQVFGVPSHFRISFNASSDVVADAVNRMSIVMTR